MNTIFQSGVILGRITQIAVQRGIVTLGDGMSLSDFLILFSEEIGMTPISDALKEKIQNEINNLMENFSSYSKGQRLEPDDARIIIGIVSRWSDMLIDEFIHSCPSQNDDDDIIQEMDEEKPTNTEVSDESDDKELIDELSGSSTVSEEDDGSLEQMSEKAP